MAILQYIYVSFVNRTIFDEKITYETTTRYSVLTSQQDNLSYYFFSLKLQKSYSFPILSLTDKSSRNNYRA